MESSSLLHPLKTNPWGARLEPTSGWGGGCLSVVGMKISGSFLFASKVMGVHMVFPGEEERQGGQGEDASQRMCTLIPEIPAWPCSAAQLPCAAATHASPTNAGDCCSQQLGQPTDPRPGGEECTPHTPSSNRTWNQQDQLQTLQGPVQNENAKSSCSK